MLSSSSSAFEGTFSSAAAKRGKRGQQKPTHSLLSWCSWRAPFSTPTGLSWCAHCRPLRCSLCTYVACRQHLVTARPHLETCLTTCLGKHAPASAPTRSAVVSLVAELSDHIHCKRDDPGFSTWVDASPVQPTAQCGMCPCVLLLSCSSTGSVVITGLTPCMRDTMICVCDEFGFLYTVEP